MAVVAAASIGRAAAEVGGSLKPGRTVWTKAAGPYHVVQSVEVPEGGTLVIEPGTTVRFDRYSLLVLGTLHAR